jgi:hypothetical protein
MQLLQPRLEALWPPTIPPDNNTASPDPSERSKSGIV